MRRFFTVPFLVEPEDALSMPEQRLLQEPRDLAPKPHDNPVRLRIEDLSESDTGSPHQGAGATIGWTEDRVTIRHVDFTADIWPWEHRATLRRRGPDPYSLQLTLETAASAVLPLRGSVVLHAAAVVVEGRACVFFGPSGIGKSSLARLSPYPSIADELVVLSSEERLVAWAGEKQDAPATLAGISEPVPVAALFQLARSKGVEIHRLDTRTAIRALLGATLVYPIPDLWQQALGVLRRTIELVPVYRLGWALQTSAWDGIRSAACGGSHP